MKQPSNPEILHRLQTAIFLDDLPKAILSQIEEEPENWERTEKLLSEIDLSACFRDSKKPHNPSRFVSVSIADFFKHRKK